MKVGDAVRYKEKPTDDVYTIGLIADTMEMADGYDMYEVISEHDRGWFSDLELEVISEASERSHS